MMQFKIGVEMVDGTEAVAIASVPDLLAFERKFDKPVTEFGAGLRLEWILWLAWHALHRAGKTSEDYDDWTAKVGNIAVGSQDGDPLPPLESTAPIGQ